MYADQVAVGVGFLEFLTRSCKIVHILGALAKIPTKGFTKMQDFYQDFQEFSQWVSIKNNPKYQSN